MKRERTQFEPEQVDVPEGKWVLYIPEQKPEMKPHAVRIWQIARQDGSADYLTVYWAPGPRICHD